MQTPCTKRNVVLCRSGNAIASTQPREVPEPAVTHRPGWAAPTLGWFSTRPSGHHTFRVFGSAGAGSSSTENGGGEGGGAGNSGNGDDNGNGNGNGGDDEEEFLNLRQAEEMAAAKGVELPADFAAVAQEGGLRLSILEQYITIASGGWLTGLLARSVPAFRDRLIVDRLYFFKILAEVCIDSGESQVGTGVYGV